jgi:hypothetical protein
LNCFKKAPHYRGFVLKRKTLQAKKQRLFHE